MKKAAVIGGGITGLTAARHLTQSGYHTLLFEASDCCGGVVRSRRADGYLVEHGPNSFQEQPEIMELIQSLGLMDQLVETDAGASKRFIVRNGAVVALPASPPALLRSPALTTRGKLRLLAEPFIRPGDPDSTESLASFAKRRLGAEALNYLLDPLVSGIYAGDPAKLSARHAFPKIHEWEQTHGSLFKGMIRSLRQRKAEGRPKPRLLSFRDGLQTLTDALAKSLEKQTYLETKVKAITGVNGKWQVLAERYGHELRDRYDAVILALPAPALASLAIQTGADDALNALTAVDHPPLRITHLGYARNALRHPLDGFGVLIPSLEERSILGALFSSSLFPGRAPADHALLTVFTGGVRHRDVADREENEVITQAARELEALGLVAGEPVFRQSVFWPKAIPQYGTKHGEFLELFGIFEKKHPGIFIASQCRDGVSLPNCAAAGQTHAERAARHLADLPD